MGRDSLDIILDGAALDMAGEGRVRMGVRQVRQGGWVLSSRPGGPIRVRERGGWGVVVVG